MAMIVDEPTAKQCDHLFERHIGVKVFGRRGTAWIQWSLIAPKDRNGREEMYLCTLCGEQGYEVKP